MRDAVMKNYPDRAALRVSVPLIPSDLSMPALRVVEPYYRLPVCFFRSPTTDGKSVVMEVAEITSHQASSPCDS